MMGCRTCSFNAGVYVADMDRWRREKIPDRLVGWLQLNTVQVPVGIQPPALGAR